MRRQTCPSSKRKLEFPAKGAVKPCSFITPKRKKRKVDVPQLKLNAVTGNVKR
jgi:hypothetical protein